MQRILKYTFLILFLAGFGALEFSHAQQPDAVTLSISPTLYDMSAEPGQEWRSSLKVVNVNPFDLTVYAEVVNFSPQGEGGDGRFNVVDASIADGSTLAEWFTISSEPITIPREQTIEIPFSVRVPEGASPGGHFAAILVGTRPIKNESGQARLQTAQMVTSLFFARVAGEVVESGGIREFMTTKSLLSSPEATFSLRFENKGNVHLQPRGEIRIYNMWGEERGIIPINQYTSFGNVLPDSIRKFLFTWKGEWSVSDVGRYTAIATLGYGSEEKKFSTSKTVFWVLPVKLLLIVSLVLAGFVGLFTWLVRVYVRHTLLMAGVNIEDYASVHKRARKEMRPSLHAPVQAGILDLTTRMQATTSFSSRLREIGQFAFQYRLFFFGFILVITFVSTIVWYVKSANTTQRSYEITYMQNESTPTKSVSSEEVVYSQLTGGASDLSGVDEERDYKASVLIVNRSGTVGAGAQMRIFLENNDYRVQGLEADLAVSQERTVIVTTNEFYTQALELSKLLKNAPVSFAAESETKAPITVFVGNDASLE
jgi:hypothetical protein